MEIWSFRDERVACHAACNCSKVVDSDQKIYHVSEYCPMENPMDEISRLC